MQSKIVSQLANASTSFTSNQSVEVYLDELSRCKSSCDKPHHFVNEMMDAYYSRKPAPNRAVHGKYFELVIGETLVQQGVQFLYYQAVVLHVPSATFDWFLYHESHPVSISCKTKPRDRWKQAAYEAMALKRVYSQASNYLIMLEKLGKMAEKKRDILQPIDHFVMATDPEFDDAVHEITQQNYVKAKKRCPIVKGVSIQHQ